VAVILCSERGKRPVILFWMTGLFGFKEFHFYI